MIVLTGKEIADAERARIKQESAAFTASTGIKPCLAVVLVGDDAPSATYVASKGKACEEMGFSHVDHHLKADCDLQTLLTLIDSLNHDRSIHGILVQFPLPVQLDETTVIQALDPDKDVDGIHPQNLGRLLLGQDGFIACTPAGVLRMLDFHGIPTSGKHVVIIGRSAIVGKPMAALLMQKNRDATVTVCHSKTQNLASITSTADILVVAMGKPAYITRDMVKPGAVVIDIGINRVPDASKKRGYHLVGDVDYEAIAPLCSAITPVPGGVGVMTIAMLMSNTLRAAKRLVPGLTNVEK